MLRDDSGMQTRSWTLNMFAAAYIGRDYLSFPAGMVIPLPAAGNLALVGVYGDGTKRRPGDGVPARVSSNVRIQLDPWNNARPLESGAFVANSRLRVKRTDLPSHLDKPYDVTIDNSRKKDDVDRSSTTKAKNEITVEMDANGIPVGLPSSLRGSWESFAPGIDYELTFFIKLLSRDILNYRISGWHNKFPWYEIIVNKTLLYSYSVTVTAATLLEGSLDLLKELRFKAMSGFLIRDRGGSDHEFIIA